MVPAVASLCYDGGPFSDFHAKGIIHSAKERREAGKPRMIDDLEEIL